MKDQENQKPSEIRWKEIDELPPSKHGKWAKLLKELDSEKIEIAEIPEASKNASVSIRGAAIQNGLPYKARTRDGRLFVVREKA